MRRLFTFILCTLLITSAFTVCVSAAVWDGNTPSSTVAATYSGGNGTADAPYQIATPKDLAQLAANVNDGMDYNGVYFILTADIVLNDVSSFANWGKSAPSNEWTPIGASASTPFRGHFDGGSHKIVGLYISTYIPYAGLFGYVSAGSIKNLYMESAYVDGADYVGAVVGYMTETVYFVESNSYISSCSVDGFIHGSRYVGGIVGYTDVSITGCESSADVSAERFAAGGIVGINEGAEVSRSFSEGTVSGPTALAGGIVGKNTGSVTECYNVGAVYAVSVAGGIVGYNGGTVENCFNAGPVGVTDVIAGGIVGENDGTLTTSYNVGAIQGTAEAYAVVGKRVSGSVSACYYLNLYGMTDRSGCKGLSRTQTKKSAAYSGFNFSDAWVSGTTRYPYPILRNVGLSFICSHISTVEEETPCTCETDGVYKTVCTVCETVIATENIAGGHDYVLTATEAPTCINTGYKTYTCSICGDSYRTAYGKKAAHTMQAWVTTKAATCTENGERHRDCAFCDYTETESVPSIEHSHRAKTVEADCLNVGYTEHICIFCEDRYISDEVAAKGHTYSTRVTEPNCVRGGYTEYTCTVCGEHHVGDEVEAKGHTPSEWIVLAERSFTDNGVRETYCTVCGIALERTSNPAYGFLCLGIAIAVLGVLTLVMIFVAASIHRKKEYYASLAKGTQPETPPTRKRGEESPHYRAAPLALEEDDDYDEDDTDDTDDDYDDDADDRLHEILFMALDGDEDDDEDDDDWI